MNDVLKAALWYSKNGFSVFPVKPNKRPYEAWAHWQSHRADEKQIKEWWQRWPEAQVAIVCGAISNLTVIDADSPESYTSIQENFIPDSMVIPAVKTSKGNHLYFRHEPGIANAVRFFGECDLKNDGGYVLAPPSKNEKGKYSWLPGLKISDVDPPTMPAFLSDTIKQYAHAGTNNANIIDSIPFSENDAKCVERDGVTSPTITNHNIRNISFDEGGRDETLFHLANHLVRSGMPEDEIKKYLYFIGKNTNPPFPDKEIDIKLTSALRRGGARVDNLTDAIRAFVSVTDGDFSVTDALRSVTISNNPDVRNKIRATLYRMYKNGELEKSSDRDGIYRRVNNDCKAQDWLDADCAPVKLYLPLELTDKVLITPGDIVLVMGSQNAGKSAFMMNIAKENRSDWRVHYFSSEMRISNFKRRMSRFNADVNDMAKKIKFYERNSNFADVIKTGEGSLNVIDYLEMHDNFYKVGKYLADIYAKLNGAVAVIALQKDPGSEFGRGASFTQEKPVLSIALDRGKAKITKCKEFPDDQENPQGKVFKFKLVQGCRFMREHMELGWHRED